MSVREETDLEKMLSTFLNITPMICALFVIGIHTYNISATDNMLGAIGVIEGFFSHGIFTAAVPIFFIISGYLFFYQVKSMADIARKLRRRLFSVVVPFLAWSALYYAISVVGFKFGIIQSKVEVNLFAAVRAILFYEYDFPLWFMFNLMVYFVLTPGIYYVLKSKVASIVILAVSAVLGIIGLEWVITVDGMSRTLFSPNFFAYFLCGCLLSKIDYSRVFDKTCKIPYALCIIAFCGFGFLESLFFDARIYVFNNRLAVPFVVTSALILLSGFPIRCGRVIFKVLDLYQQWLYTVFIRFWALYSAR